MFQPLYIFSLSFCNIYFLSIILIRCMLNIYMWGLDQINIRNYIKNKIMIILPQSHYLLLSKIMMSLIHHVFKHTTLMKGFDVIMLSNNSLVIRKQFLSLLVSCSVPVALYMTYNGAF